MAQESVGTLVDLFCGCGGFSLGAELAGFRSLAAIDVDGTLQSAYRRNFPGSRAIQASVCDIDEADWLRLLCGKRPDGVIGGPPCQGFSPIGKRQKDDPRNTLISEFFRHVNALKPRFFVMENVEALLRSENRALLDAALATLNRSYTILEPMVLNAADFGAATIRRRAVIVGYSRDEMEDLSTVLFEPNDPITRPTVRDAISDLPSPIAETSDSTEYGWAPYPDVDQLSNYARSLRAPPPPHLGSPDTNAKLVAGLVSGLTTTRHSKEIAQRYARIPGGKSDPTTKSYRLTWDGQCPTLRAGTGAERGAFQAVRPLHPEEGRVITIREAARLQGFPDWFTFHPTKWHSFRMIGNSVSPLVSFAIFSQIATRLDVALAA